jgi:hypothetical protein
MWAKRDRKSMPPEVELVPGTLAKAFSTAAGKEFFDKVARSYPMKLEIGPSP